MNFSFREAYDIRGMCPTDCYTTFGGKSTSLKFTVLNPKGRIWTMVAGGGASVIYADIVMLRSLETMQNTVELQMRRRCCSMPELLLICN
uniref:ATP-citrate synthase citrate-binding domain-containing protein n=1 Tax=Nelumbo nucifera TaxID=4432 RepID=A0A822YZ43_NELNU|nr:TPA_asm: hypothetical protein HUJ06_013687 [Nelumbo nucifera]